MGSRLDKNIKLATELDNNTEFTYAHLVKFQRPRVSGGVDDIGTPFLNKSDNFGHISDAGFEIFYDDGSIYTDENGNTISNGPQSYTPNKLKKVPTITETNELVASSIKLSFVAGNHAATYAVDYTLSAPDSTTKEIIFTPTTDTQAIQNMIAEGFKPGDKLKFMLEGPYAIQGGVVEEKEIVIGISGQQNTQIYDYNTIKGLYIETDDAETPISGKPYVVSATVTGQTNNLYGVTTLKLNKNQTLTNGTQVYFYTEYTILRYALDSSGNDIIVLKITNPYDVWGNSLARNPASDSRFSLAHLPITQESEEITFITKQRKLTNYVHRKVWIYKIFLNTSIDNATEFTDTIISDPSVTFTTNGTVTYGRKIVINTGSPYIRVGSTVTGTFTRSTTNSTPVFVTAYSYATDPTHVYLSEEITVNGGQNLTFSDPSSSAILVYKGTLDNATFKHNPDRTSLIEWSITNNWANFNRVNGRITTDESHQALDNQGLPQPGATFKPSYANDYGFMHSEKIVNVLARFSRLEDYTTQRLDPGRKRAFWKQRIPFLVTEYHTRTVTNEVDVKMELSSRHLPIVYGVRKLKGIPIFADLVLNTSNSVTASSGDSADTLNELHIGEAICEGPIGGIYDITTDGNTSVALSLNDLSERGITSSGYIADDNDYPADGNKTDGYVIKGQTLSSVTVIPPTTASPNTASSNSIQLDTDSQKGVQAKEGVDVTYYSKPQVETWESNADWYLQANGVGIDLPGGLTHEQYYTLSRPLKQVFEFHAGFSDQETSKMFFYQANQQNFGYMTQSSLTTNNNTPYWSQDHRLLDTAWVARKIMLTADSTEAPETEYTVSGKLVQCYNYDNAYGTDHKGFISINQDGTVTSVDIGTDNPNHIHLKPSIGKRYYFYQSSDNAPIVKANGQDRIFCLDSFRFRDHLGTDRWRHKFDLDDRMKEIISTSGSAQGKFYISSTSNPSSANKYYLSAYNAPLNIRRTIDIKIFPVGIGMKVNGSLFNDSDGVANFNYDGITDGFQPYTQLPTYNNMQRNFLVSSNGERYYWVQFLSNTQAKILWTDRFAVTAGHFQDNDTLYIKGIFRFSTDATAIPSGVAIGSTLIFGSKAGEPLQAYSIGNIGFWNTTTRVVGIGKPYWFDAEGITNELVQFVYDNSSTGIDAHQSKEGEDHSDIDITSLSGERYLSDHGLDYVATGDSRPSTNPAICLLDYLRSGRYGAGISPENINFESFKRAAQICDTQSDVTIQFPDHADLYSNNNSAYSIAAGLAVGDKFVYRPVNDSQQNFNGRDVQWFGQIKTWFSANNYTWITFTNVHGKLVTKWDLYSPKQPGRLFWKEGYSVRRMPGLGETSVTVAATNYTDEHGTGYQYWATSPREFNRSGWESNTSHFPKQLSGIHNLYNASSVITANMSDWYEDANANRLIPIAGWGGDTGADNNGSITELYFPSAEAQNGGTFVGVSGTTRNYGDPFLGNFIRDPDGGNGYSIYDSDDVDYYKYLGWPLKEQKYVTRHQINMILDGGATLFQNIENLLDHFNAQLISSQGKFELQVNTTKDEDTEGDTWTKSVSDITLKARYITKDDIIGSINLKDYGNNKSFNSISSSFPDPFLNFDNKSVNYFNSTYKKEDAGIRKQTNFSLPGITNYFNARMAVKQILDSSRFNRTISFKMRPIGIILFPTQLIKIDYPDLGWTDSGGIITNDGAKLFRIKTITLNTDCTVNITAEEYADNVYIITPPKLSIFNTGTGATNPTKNPAAVTNLAVTTQASRGANNLRWTPSADLPLNTGYYEVWRYQPHTQVHKDYRDLATDAALPGAVFTDPASLSVTVGSVTRKSEKLPADLKSTIAGGATAQKEIYMDFFIDETHVGLQNYIYWVRPYMLIPSQTSTAKTRMVKYYGNFNANATYTDISTSLAQTANQSFDTFTTITPIVANIEPAAILVPTDKDGNDSSITYGNIPDITFRVTEGTNFLTYNKGGAGSLANGEFDITVSVSTNSGSNDITIHSSDPVDTGTAATIGSNASGNLSNMISDEVTITITAVGKSNEGVDFTRSATTTLSKSKTGEAGTSGITAELTSESVSIPAFETGATTSDSFSNATTIFKIFNGANLDTSNWTVTTTTANCTINSGNNVNCTVTDMPQAADTGTVTFTATRTGYSTQTKVFTLTKTKQGNPTIGATLSSSAHTLPADSSNSTLSYVGATTVMKVYVGNSDDSANWTFTASPASTTACTYTFTDSAIGGTLTVTNLDATIETKAFTITASKTGSATQSQVYTITKVKQGNDGAEGPGAKQAMRGFTRSGTVTTFPPTTTELPDPQEGQIANVFTSGDGIVTQWRYTSNAWITDSASLVTSTALEGMQEFKNSTATIVMGNNDTMLTSITNGGAPPGTIAIGKAAGKNVPASSDSNIFIGENTGLKINEGGNVLIGRNNFGFRVNSGTITNVASSMDSSDLNISIGNDIASNVAFSDRNIFIGRRVAQGVYQTNPTNADLVKLADNIAIGNEAMYQTSKNLDGLDPIVRGNICIGTSSGRNIGGGPGLNIAIGVYSCGGALTGSTAMTGNRNITIGGYAGAAFTTARYNQLIGENVGKEIKTGEQNVLIGQIENNNTNDQSYGRRFRWNPTNCVIIGYGAGTGHESSREKNVYIGPLAGGNRATTTGEIRRDSTIAIGYRAGATQNTTNCRDQSYGSIHLGEDAGFESSDPNGTAGTTNSFNHGTRSYNIHIGYRAGYKSVGRNNIIIGRQAGQYTQWQADNSSSFTNEAGSDIAYKDSVLLGNDITEELTSDNQVILGNKNQLVKIPGVFAHRRRVISLGVGGPYTLSADDSGALITLYKGMSDITIYLPTIFKRTTNGSTAIRATDVSWGSSYGTAEEVNNSRGVYFDFMVMVSSSRVVKIQQNGQSTFNTIVKYADGNLSYLTNKSEIQFRSTARVGEKITITCVDTSTLTYLIEMGQTVQNLEILIQ